MFLLAGAMISWHDQNLGSALNPAKAHHYFLSFTSSRVYTHNFPLSRPHQRPSSWKIETQVDGSLRHSWSSELAMCRQYQFSTSQLLPRCMSSAVMRTGFHASSESCGGASESWRKGEGGRELAARISTACKGVMETA